MATVTPNKQPTNGYDAHCSTAAKCAPWRFSHLLFLCQEFSSHFLWSTFLSWELFLTLYRNIEYLVFNMAFLSHLRAIVARSLYFCICICVCVFGAAHCCNGSFLSHFWASIVRSSAHPVVQLKVKLLPNLLSPTYFKVKLSPEVVAYYCWSVSRGVTYIHKVW